MIKIKENRIDLILQTEDHTTVQKVFDKLGLNIDEILIICTEVFLQRFIHSIYDNLTDVIIIDIEDKLIENNNYISIDYKYKNKIFKFHFIITSSESVIINNPFKGEQTFNVGFKEIKI